MAARKSSSPPKNTESGIPRLYAEDGEDGTGELRLPARLTLPAHAHAHAHAETKAVPEPAPETVRALPSPIDESGALPDLGEDDKIPNLAEEDGTHTDKTAMMLDRSLRQGDRPTLTILTGVSAGMVFPLDKLPITIGRGKGVDVQLSDVGVSRKHARVVSPTSGLYVLEDLGATNGVRVNGVRSTRCDLHAGDRIQLGPEVVLQFAYLDHAEENLTKQLYTAATRDALTFALNRGTFDERLTAELSYARRHDSRLAIIMFDVDHFKRVNDTHGHVAGDAVLREVAQTVLRTIRSEDVFGRYGGEEFAVLARGETCEQARLFAERLRVAVAAAEVRWQSALLRVTISLGVAELGQCAAAVSAKEFLGVADKRLYAAKQSGRNRVCAE